MKSRTSHYTADLPAVRAVICLLAAGFLILFVALPVIVVFGQAFAKGWDAYMAALAEPESQAAIRLTLIVTAIAIPCNLVFGLAASWAIAKFEFRGKRLLITLIELPFSVSPVISGLIYALLFGGGTLLGTWFLDRGIQVLFSTPGLVLATIFVTFPFIARELIPLMEEQGTEAEEAAVMLGANGWQTFWHVTLPNIRWGVLYGVLLSTARAMGEFGAVSVVSGHIAGLTNTIPLQVEALYNQYNFVAAFAVASTLALFAIITLVLKCVIEYYAREEQQVKE